MGEDRLILMLQAQAAQSPQLADAYIAPLGEAQNPAALALARELRRSSPDRRGLHVELGDGTFRLKKSFEAADKTARTIVLLGEDEVASGILTIKDFSTGVQTKIPRSELSAHLLALKN